MVSSISADVTLITKISSNRSHQRSISSSVAQVIGSVIRRNHISVTFLHIGIGSERAADTDI